MAAAPQFGRTIVYTESLADVYALMHLGQVYAFVYQQWCLQVFVHRIRKYIGAYMVHLKGRVDAIVMSAGVGENSPPVRQLLLAHLEASPVSSVCLVCMLSTVLFC